jgi:hypothetical protein
LIDDPEPSLWFKELKSLKEEVRGEVFRFLKYLNEKEKDRILGGGK